MSDRQWNEQQLAAITARGKSIVVSAAAGSGKTSVLTERVLTLIEEGEDIERMLIVTFTNLAASEMRERIYRRLQDASLTQNSPRLAVQAEKCVFADISTIHAFCNRLVRDNFAYAGVSPTFTVGSEPELNLLKQRALDHAIEGVQSNPGMNVFLSRYSPRGNMQGIKNVVSDIYSRVISMREPQAWLDKAESHFDSADFASTLFDEYMDLTSFAAGKAAQFVRERSNLWREAGFDQEADLSECERIEMMKSIKKHIDNVVLPEIAHINVKAKGAPNGKSKTLTNKANKCFESLRDYCGNFKDKVNKERLLTAQDGKIFLALTRDFMKRYARAKREKNVLDHDDALHYALKALSVPNIAGRYQQKYSHVFVDEYQDINDIQHAIIRSLERGNNDFLVGDVKQCIYMFRESNPDLLIRRCNELRDDGLIEMNINYRSEPGVIDVINGVMHHMMTEETGGVAYVGGQQLCAGREGVGDVRVVLAGLDEDDAITSEGLEIAQTIRLLKDEGFEYGDIAVLRPEVSGSGRQIAKILGDLGIPVVRGFESANIGFGDITVFVNLLSLIDGNSSDTALVSVMRYPYFGFAERELAAIRISADQIKKEQQDKSFYYAVRTFVKDSPLGQKVRRFWEKINNYRMMAESLVLSDFLMRLRQEVRFEEYALTSPGGKSNDGVIRTFISGVSALNLVRISDVLEMAERVMASGDSTQTPGEVNAVYITTIHKSKGLEFPAVILSGMHKRINQADASGSVLVGRELGIALDMVDEVTRVKKPTLHKKSVAQQMKKEKLSETVRLLYVGMTRAIRKLIICGAGQQVRERWREEKAEGWQLEATTYFDLIIPALNMYCMASNRDFEDIVTIAQDAPLCGKSVNRRERLNTLFEVAEKTLPKEMFDKYANQKDLGVPSKLSVSALKRMHEPDVLLPAVLPSNDKEIPAAQRGTLMHKVLQKIGLDEKTADAVAVCIHEMAEQGVIDHQLEEYVDTKKIAGFLLSDIAGRARRSGRCLFEAPFCLQMSAEEAGVMDSKDVVIVQGVIDLCFLEENQWVIVDYKTDRVSATDTNMAAEKYRVQLELYQKALERITKISVKQKCIYYLENNMAVYLD